MALKEDLIKQMEAIVDEIAVDCGKTAKLLYEVLKKLFLTLWIPALNMQRTS